VTGTPRIVVLSAPSGGGKTTISRTLLERYPDRFGYSVSATTRPPRPGEQNGQAYYFLSRSEFERRRGAGEFLESAEYAGELYGTLKQEVERVLGAGRNVVLDIEVNGARAVWRQYPESVQTSIFLLPPSAGVLIERLRGRKTEAGEALARRIDTAIWEVQQARAYRHIVVNDVLDDAVAAIVAIVAQQGRTPHQAAATLPEEIERGLTVEANRIRQTVQPKEQ